MELHLATNRFGDRYIREINEPNFKEVSARTAFIDRFGKITLEPDSLYIIIGTDSGLLVRFVDKLTIPESSYVIFIEDEHVLNFIRNDIPTNNRISVCTHTSLHDTLKKHNVEDFYFTDRLHIIESLACSNTRNTFYQQFSRNAWEAIHRIIYSLGVSANHRLFIERILQNLPESRHGAELIVGALKGYTGVMLGAGPSLDRLLPWVREHRDKLAVFAVARIAERLQQEGIVPDVVVSVDPFDVSFYESRAMLEFPGDTVLVHSTHVQPALLSQWRGPALFAGPRYPWGPAVFDTPGPTVGHAGVWAAFQAGCSPIVLGGIDLCFSKEGKSHAVGDEEVAADLVITQGVIHVRTNGGWIAETDLPFAKGIETLALIAAAAREEGVAVVNPAPEAARVEHVEHIPLEEIHISPTREPARKRIIQRIPPDTRANRLNHYRKALEELERGRSTFRKIVQIAERGIRANRKLLQNPRPHIARSIDRELRRYEKQLKTRYAGFKNALIRFDTKRFIKALKPSTEIKEAPVEAGLAFFRAFRDASLDFIKLIHDAETRLKSRMQEEAEIPDWGQVFEQWEKDRHPGRAVLWKARNPGRVSEVPDWVREKLERYEKEYRRLLKEEASLPLLFDETAALARAMQCFQAGDADALRQMLGALASHPSPKAKILHVLVEGLLADLEGDFQQAAKQYMDAASMADDGTAVWYDSLRQLSVLYLEKKQYDLALEILRKLSDADPVYMPRYAKVLAALGRPLDALDVYQKYLSNHPDDLEAMLELGLLCHRMGAHDVARDVLRHVLRSAGEGQHSLALRARTALESTLTPVQGHPVQDPAVPADQVSEG